MGKRIHKREGSVAWGNAMRKSASRMARAVLRAPESRQRELITNYFRNKGELQTKELLQKRLLDKAIERRRAKTMELLEKFESTIAEKAEIFVTV